MCVRLVHVYKDGIKYANVRLRNMNDITTFEEFSMAGLLQYTSKIYVREDIARSIQQFEDKGFTVKKSTGILQFSSSAMKSNKKTLGITVDITPAIEVRGGIADIVSRDEVILEEYYHQLIEDDRYMLVFERKWLDDTYSFKFLFTHCRMHIV